MAHSCPECWLVCHCGGDIDDLCFDDTDEAMRCTHCPDEFADIDDEYPLEDEGHE